MAQTNTQLMTNIYESGDIVPIICLTTAKTESIDKIAKLVI